MQDNFPTESTAEHQFEFKSTKEGRNTKRIGALLVGVTLLGALGYYGINTLGHNQNKTDKSEARRRPQVTPVKVASVTQKTVPVQLQAIGNVQAESTVSVTPQVGGKITGVYFKKGQDVKKGQLLFTLDDQTQQAAIQQAKGTLARDLAQVQQYRAALAKDLTLVGQAQANLAKDQAQAQYAQAQAIRYGNLLKEGAVSKDQAQQYSTNAQATAATLQADRQAIANAQASLKVDQAQIQNAEGVVSADEGVLKNAQVQLSYTKIYAPIDGRAGDILVNQGNVVAANSTNPLLTIYKINPIQVSFAVPEANLPEIQKYMKNNKLTVDVTPNNKAQPIRGVLAFVNNKVDNTTGTIQLMGEFNNANGQLWPGQYVNTTLKLTQEPNARVVPSQAVQNGPNGQFVFVVKPDKTVENVPVTVGSTIDGLSVIKSGLQPGQQVVTDGQANLVTGNQVCGPSIGKCPQGMGSRKRKK
ncbi:efflux RND transporter periplasmic adaptor subunit [Iningainema tapete]|uniref:Efflux RND transporter periplasmic adaptor subunit n=1 Tax=Iningainema tapete BLCC-T55 TaxID=2748662 RepID=A0A8J6XYF0_9CYAN|nr:efflux RND transporter periplasmic adaptor subunit [Iningainema tapete]MBD2775363.1 efflux RND transporter periplasmic adaptor subunit [Iningainema tapete BLCC-T55]